MLEFMIIISNNKNNSLFINVVFNKLKMLDNRERDVAQR